MVGQNPPHTYRKDGVFYYCRRIPKELLTRYDESRIVMSLRTKSSKAAGWSAAVITGQLDEYWISLRIADLQIPLITSGINHHDRYASIKLSEALEKYHALRGIGKDKLFFRASSRFVKYVIEELNNQNVCDYSSMDAARFKDRLFGRGLSSSSVKKPLLQYVPLWTLPSERTGWTVPTLPPIPSSQTMMIKRADSQYPLIVWRRYNLSVSRLMMKWGG